MEFAPVSPAMVRSPSTSEMVTEGLMRSSRCSTCKFIKFPCDILPRENSPYELRTNFYQQGTTVVDQNGVAFHGHPAVSIWFHKRIEGRTMAREFPLEPR